MRSLSLLLGLALLATSSALPAEEVVTLDTRPGATQSFLLLQRDAQPVVAVILFPGGPGVLELNGTTLRKGANNFLVRSRERFADAGLLVAVVDAPSDRQGSEGMLGRFRVSPEHATDIAAVIAYLKRRSQVPVWLVGTSRGTESAAHVAAHTQESLGGLVLTSSVTVTGRKGVSVTDMPIERITVPTLITAHRTDACSETPPAGAEQIRRRLTRAAKVEVRHFDGGDTPRSNACGALSYHGYLGIEKEVVDAITGFIKANGPTQAVAVMPATTGIQKE